MVKTTLRVTLQCNLQTLYLCSYFFKFVFKGFNTEHTIIVLNIFLNHKSYKEFIFCYIYVIINTNKQQKTENSLWPNCWSIKNSFMEWNVNNEFQLRNRSGQSQSRCIRIFEWASIAYQKSNVFIPRLMSLLLFGTFHCCVAF